MLMQELLQLNEGRVKEALFDLIEQGIKHAPIGKASYELAVAKIVSYIRANDWQHLTAGMPDEEVEGYVKDNFSKAEHAEHLGLNEAEEESEWPKVIAKADEYRVEVDEDEQVSLLDGKDTVKVTMPLVIWKQLIRN